MTHRGGGAEDRGANTPLAAVIVTLHDGSSYDPLFREFRQESPEGRVSVWEASSLALGELLEHLQQQRASGGLASELASELASVNPDSAVFNWECCSGCSDAGFVGTALVMRAAEALLSRGHTLMFSDFSLKALIGAWSRGEAPEALGPCPLVKLGEFSAGLELRFDPKALQSCGSAQLERVGDLCESGEASVGAMGGTIAYTLDEEALRSAPYRVEALTVATAFDGVPALQRFGEGLRAGRVCAVGAHRGAAGHARLRYPSGGSMLLSCGHWVELIKLDVTAERLVDLVAQTYGREQSVAMSGALAAAAPIARAAMVQQYAKQFVVQSSPGAYTKLSEPGASAPPKKPK